MRLLDNNIFMKGSMQCMSWYSVKMQIVRRAQRAFGQGAELGRAPATVLGAASVGAQLAQNWQPTLSRGAMRAGHRGLASPEVRQLARCDTQVGHSCRQRRFDVVTVPRVDHCAWPGVRWRVGRQWSRQRGRLQPAQIHNETGSRMDKALHH